MDEWGDKSFNNEDPFTIEVLNEKVSPPRISREVDQNEIKRATTICPIINCFGKCLFGKLLQNFL